MNKFTSLLIQVGVGLLNLIMALITLGVVARFWWRHRHQGLSMGWWILSLAFGAFAIAQTLEFRRLLGEMSSIELSSLEITSRFVFMAILIIGLSRLFDDVIATKQKSLDDAEKTIRLQAGAMRQGQEVQLLYTISQALVGTLELEAVLKDLCRAARELMAADSVSVRLPQPMTDGFRFAVDFGSALESKPDALDPRVDDLCWKVVQAGRPAVIDDVHAHPMFGPETPDWLKSLGAFPLRRGREVIGVLTIVYEDQRAFTEDEQRFIAALADQAAVAVHNAQLHEQTQQLAATDSLTGLANRRHFDEALGIEARRARRYRTATSLLLIDLDNFKQCNDEFGHPAGDAYLEAFANFLGQHTRETDIVARYGGDEFAIIMPNTAPAAARHLAQRIKDSAANFYIERDGHKIQIRASTGIAGWEPGQAISPNELIEAADKAMYADKSTSRPPSDV